MARNVLLSLVLLILGSYSYAAAHHECRSGQACITVASLKAANTALIRFKKDQPKVVLDKFTIVIEEMADHFAIEFVPDSIPTKEGSHGDLPFIEVPSGSGNEYGRDILYEVSKNGDKILNTLFSK